MIDVSKKVQILKSSMSHLAQIDSIYIGSKVDTQSIVKELKAMNITKVIDMKKATETSFDDAQAFTDEGITYINLPVLGVDSFDSDFMSRMDEELTENTLVYCMSGNRVSAWLALHLNQKQSVSKKQAIEVAESTGLTKEILKEKISKLLK